MGKRLYFIQGGRMGVSRAELFENMIESLRRAQIGDSPNIEEVAIMVRNRVLRKGRWLGRFTVSRTLLLKGLQFDHAIVLDAGALDTNYLYVAPTRVENVACIGGQVRSQSCGTPVIELN
jgi:hypothetical protein